MRPLITVVSLLLCALLAAVPSMIWMAVKSTSGGDFTWRMQAIISYVQVAFPLAWFSAVISVAVGLKHQNQFRRKLCWSISLGLLVIGCAISIYMHFAFDRVILGWNPNLPPMEWEVLRDRWMAWNWGRALASVVAMIGVLACCAFKESHEPKPA